MGKKKEQLPLSDFYELAIRLLFSTDAGRNATDRPHVVTRCYRDDAVGRRRTCYGGSRGRRAYSNLILLNERRFEITRGT